jgi:hypothetical protein
MYKVVPPPYNEKYTTRELPPGYLDSGVSGKGSAKESLQVIGGALEGDVSGLDLGWARINLTALPDGGADIEYVHDKEANVGSRNKTVGQGVGQIPIEAWKEAKAQGADYKTFITTYSGELVGGEQVISAAQSDVQPQAVEAQPAIAQQQVAEMTGSNTVSQTMQRLDDTYRGEEDEDMLLELLRKRRGKKPWYEEDVKTPPQRIIRRPSGNTYYGYELLPPNLSGEL